MRNAKTKIESTASLSFKFTYIALFFLATNVSAQDYGCDKCDMLREECEVAVSPKKEEVCAFFRQECLQTDTVFVSDQGKVASEEKATAFQVVAKGKCIDYKEVKEFEKNTKKETRSYQITKKDTVYSFATTQASYPGGDVELVKYLSNNISFPKAAKDKKVQGTVYLRFVVTKEGAISGIKAMRSPDPELTKEAMRVVKNMPKWEPARYKKDKVSMIYVLPVKFKLN